MNSKRAAVPCASGAFLFVSFCRQDLEAVVSAEAFAQDFDVRNVSAGRATLAKAQHFIDPFGRPLQCDLDGSVVAVSDPTRKTHGSGGAFNPSAITNALDASFDADMDCSNYTHGSSKSQAERLRSKSLQSIYRNISG